MWRASPRRWRWSSPSPEDDRWGIAAGSGREARRAPGRASHLRDRNRRGLSSLGTLAPGPAAAAQSMGERRALGDAPAPVPAHLPNSSGRRTYGACDRARGARGNRPNARSVPVVFRGRAGDAGGRGEKPAHERFPGADNTYSIEAMMQDGKALQAGTAITSAPISPWRRASAIRPKPGIWPLRTHELGCLHAPGGWRGDDAW